MRISTYWMAMRNFEMKITFTGTQEGMTNCQKRTLHKILNFFSEDTSLIFMHGDCIGADAQAHTIVKEFAVDIELFPCNIKEKRAWCKGAKVTHAIMSPLKRNDVMAKRCDLMIAAPKSLKEEVRSGTWATIRYGRKYNKTIILLVP